MRQRYIPMVLLCLWVTSTAVQSAPGDVELLWQLDGFSTPESVLHDPQAGVLYVSSMEGGGYDKDGKGFISRVDLAGTMLERDWITGLNAPRGMGLVDRRLYVADIDRLLEIDVDSGRILNRYDIKGAIFLNDVAVSATGEVYVSDTETNRIHRLREQQVSTWLEGPALDHPNGLLVEGTRLLIGSWGTWMDPDAPSPHLGRMLYVPLVDNPPAPQDLLGADPIGNLDGVQASGDGTWLVSDWVAGKVYHLHGDGSRHVLVDAGQGTADIAYIRERRLLLVPLMKQDALAAYQLPATLD